MGSSLLLALCCLIGGNVHTSAGTPIAHAQVSVVGSHRYATTTDVRGHFSVQVENGTYQVSVTSPGFSGARIARLEVNHPIALDIALQSLNSAHIRTIARIIVDGRLALSQSSIPTVNLVRSDIERVGYDRIIDALSEVPSVTFARPDGGSATGPTVVALRGPDPSETLVLLDGQLLNDGNTGDLDLSRFPVAAFSGIDVSEGLGPQDRLGSNTIGGAVNVVSLQPVRGQQTRASTSIGSFGSSDSWVNTSGTRGHLGYAIAVDNQQESGYVNQDGLLCNPAASTPCAGAPTVHLGSTISSRAALLNMRYSFSQASDLAFRVFTLGDVRDESGLLNAPLAGTPGFVGPGDALFGQNLRAYQLRSHFGLGAGSLQATFGLSNDGVNYSGATPGSPYDLTHIDRRGTADFAWTRSFSNSELTIAAGFRGESLIGTGIAPIQKRTVRTFSVHGATHPTSRLSLDGGIYSTNDNTFGSSLDGRAAFAYNLAPGQLIRFSVGTGFRAPLLIEQFLFPLSALPPPDVNGIIIGQGNPNERPEHATEYELGYARHFGPTATLDVSLYRTNLRDPIENYYPVPIPGTTQFSFPINVGNVVYQGAEIRLSKRFTHLFVSANYGLNVAYPKNFPGLTVSNPTSGSFLVNGAQFIGIPQQVASLGLDWSAGAYHAAIDTSFRGSNNSLNQGPYATVDAGFGRSFGKIDVTLAGTNLTNAVAGRFTSLQNGVPYYGVTGQTPSGSLLYGNLPTNRYFVEPAGVRLIVTIHS